MALHTQIRETGHMRSDYWGAGRVLFPLILPTKACTTLSKRRTEDGRRKMGEWTAVRGWKGHDSRAIYVYEGRSRYQISWDHQIDPGALSSLYLMHATAHSSCIGADLSAKSNRAMVTLQLFNPKQTVVKSRSSQVQARKAKGLTQLPRFFHPPFFFLFLSPLKGVWAAAARTAPFLTLVRSASIWDKWLHLHTWQLYEQQSKLTAAILCPGGEHGYGTYDWLYIHNYQRYRCNNMHPLIQIRQVLKFRACRPSRRDHRCVQHQHTQELTIMSIPLINKCSFCINIATSISTQMRDAKCNIPFREFHRRTLHIAPIWLPHMCSNQVRITIQGYDVRVQ